MQKEINCRGMACPSPVMQLRDILEKGTPETISIIVDNEAARENVSRFLEHKNYTVTIEKAGVDFRVVGTAGEGSCEFIQPSEYQEDQGTKKIMVMVGTDRLGHGDDELGTSLIINFLKTLKEMGPDLWHLVFVNSGVKLTIEGSEALPALQGYAADGVQVLVCGTCLNHFKLLEKKEVGETTNMLDIVTALQLADSVINI